LGPIPNPQSPIPNPQSPIPIEHINNLKLIYYLFKKNKNKMNIYVFFSIIKHSTSKLIKELIILTYK